MNNIRPLTYNMYLEYEKTASELLYNATNDLSVEDFQKLLTVIKQIISEYEEGEDNEQ